MKKIILTLSVRKGLTTTKIGDYDIEHQYTNEMFFLSKLATFKDDALLVADIKEVEEEEEN